MTKSTTLRTLGEIATYPAHLIAAKTEFNNAISALGPSPDLAAYANALSKFTTLTSEVLAPIAEVSKYIGGIPALYDLYVNLKSARHELSTQGKITDSTAKNIVDSVAGIIPAVRVLERFLGLTATVVKVASSGSVVLDSSAYESTAADLLNAVVGSNKDAVDYYSEFLEDPNQYNNFANYDAQTVLSEVLNRADLAGHISKASAGSAWSQLFLLNQRVPTDAEVAAHQAESRPLLFWQQSALLYKAEVIEDFLGEGAWTPESAEFLHGVYKSMEDGSTDDHLVGGSGADIAWWTLPNVLFGTDSDSRSVFFKNNYWGTAVADTFNGGMASDDIYGFGGSDVLGGGDSADTLVGGSGNDILDKHLSHHPCFSRLYLLNKPSGLELSLSRRNNINLRQEGPANQC